MASSSAFENIPPFPDDVPVADIPVISYSQLRSNGKFGNAASDAFFKACREQGFVLLDLRGDEQGEALLDAVGSMFELNTALFGELDIDELKKFEADFPRTTIGYKASGVLRTPENGSKKDMQHWYSLSRDDVLGISSTPHRDPEILVNRRDQCQRFTQRAHAVIRDLLAHLDTHLGLAPGTLDAIMPLDKLSDTSLRLLSAPPCTSDEAGHIYLGGHCDVGTVTMLFNILGGLQVLPLGRENVDANWRYVRPQPGCAIINIGDSLVELSGEVLCSSLHRVIRPPGAQATILRQSVAYAVRPAHEGIMKRLNGTAIPPLPEGAEEETRSVDDWATFKTKEIMDGVKPRTKGGRGLLHDSTANAGRVAPMVA